MFCGTPNSESRGISDSVARSLDPFLYIAPFSIDNKCLFLVLLCLVMPCSVNTPERPALFCGKMEWQWIWGRRELGLAVGGGSEHWEATVGMHSMREE